jgi:hypothetical protein
MNEMHDLSAFDFEQFVAFIFDRQPEPWAAGNQSDHWYWHVKVTFDPARIANFYVRLFNDPEFLLQRFTPAQLEEGFWAIQSSTLDCSVYYLIWIEELPFTLRADCVRSMYHLFEKLFRKQQLFTADGMWWDSLTYDWHCGNRSRSNGGEDLQMQDVIFGTLARLLQSDSVVCQSAALHGLGHLHHPETTVLIKDFVDRNSKMSDELRNYALAASKFNVL